MTKNALCVFRPVLKSKSRVKQQFYQIDKLTTLSFSDWAGCCLNSHKIISGETNQKQRHQQSWLA